VTDRQTETEVMNTHGHGRSQLSFFSATYGGIPSG